MAIKAGNIVHVGNDTYLINRIQTGGPGQVNIKRETVREVGNYLSVGQVVDTPDLSFSLESYDVSCALEALMLDEDPTITHTYDLSAAVPLNIKGAFKGGLTATSPYATVDSVAIPYLLLESMAYKFGLKTDASQTATLKGDSIYYNPGSTYIESAAGLGQPAVATVTNKALTSNVATLTVGSSHGIAVGHVITVAGVDSTFNGTNLVVTAVASTTISYAVVHANVGSTGASGTVTTTGQEIVTAHAAYAVTEGGVVRRTLSVGTKTRRLNLGTDYTETYGGVTAEAAVTTVHTIGALAATDRLRIMYASPTVESFLQTVHAVVTGTAGTITGATSVSGTSLLVNATALYAVGDVIIIDDGLGTVELVKVSAISGTVGAQTLTVSALTQNHLDGAAIATYVPTVRPAAIRGRDIDVYINSVKKISVQSVDLTWKVTLEPDEEFGNYHYVDQDFEVPDVSGTIDFKPRDAAEMLALMQQLAGVTDALQSAPATSAPAIRVDICLKNPVDGRILKRLMVPDARFDMPGYSAKVLQKLDFSAKFTSDTGALTVSDS
jgi:hypothetical protein